MPSSKRPTQPYLLHPDAIAEHDTLSREEFLRRNPPAHLTIKVLYKCRCGNKLELHITAVSLTCVRVSNETTKGGELVLTLSADSAYTKMVLAAQDIVVYARWDEEAGVWVAESEEVPGLITEADTLEALATKLETLIPEMLELNLPGFRGEPTVNLKAERTLRYAV